MQKVTFQQLLEAGVHFGHLKRKWNPAMAPYIFMEKNGIHIIDLHKTIAKINEARSALKQIAKAGKKILFVATKKQAKDIVSNIIEEIDMPYITERWSGGMLTNFATIRKAVKKIDIIAKMEEDGTFKKISKRERLQLTREKAKLSKRLGSIKTMTRQPSAIFVVDVNKEHIAVKEAKKLNIPIFGMVDTNSKPDIDFVIPSNDDASESISVIVKIMADSIKAGLTERKVEREKVKADKETQKTEPKKLKPKGKTFARKK